MDNDAGGVDDAPRSGLPQSVCAAGDGHREVIERGGRGAGGDGDASVVELLAHEVRDGLPGEALGEAPDLRRAEEAVHTGQAAEAEGHDQPALEWRVSMIWPRSAPEQSREGRAALSARNAPPHRGRSAGATALV